MNPNRTYNYLRLILAMMLGALPLAANARPKFQSILSAPLPALDNRRLEIQFPTYLVLTSSPSDDDWIPVKAAAECFLAKAQHGLYGINIEIIRWPLTRAGRTGSFDGTPFTTRSGLVGVRTSDRLEDDARAHCFSALALYNQEKNAAIFIKLKPEPEVPIGSDADHELEAIGTAIFKSVQFVK
jgi:hypothetical protein